MYALTHLVLPPEQLRLLVGGILTGQQANRLQEEEARRHPQKLGHLLWIGDLARRQLGEVGIRHLGERYLENVDFFALDQRQEQFQRTFEYRSVHAELRALSQGRFHEA